MTWPAAAAPNVAAKARTMNRRWIYQWHVMDMTDNALMSWPLFGRHTGVPANIFQYSRLSIASFSFVRMIHLSFGSSEMWFFRSFYGQVSRSLRILSRKTWFEAMVRSNEGSFGAVDFPMDADDSREATCGKGGDYAVDTFNSSTNRRIDLGANRGWRVAKSGPLIGRNWQFAGMGRPWTAGDHGRRPSASRPVCVPAAIYRCEAALERASRTCPALSLIVRRSVRLPSTHEISDG